MYSLEQIKEKVVIVWGAKIAGRLCVSMLRRMGADVVAFGDNYLKNIEEVDSLPVLSGIDASVQYPDALIVLGTIDQNIADEIIHGLENVNGEFTFLYYHELEYLYEVFRQGETSKYRLWNTFNNVYTDPEYEWRKKIDREILTEYYYKVNDDDVKKLANKITPFKAVKILYLLISSDKMDLVGDVLLKLKECNNIGHIVLITDGIVVPGEDVLARISDNIWYIICDKECSLGFQHAIKKIGVILEFMQLPPNLFVEKKDDKAIVLTEEIIADAVKQYVKGEEHLLPIKKDVKSKQVYIVQIFNGLANQMLMYLFGRFLEEESGNIVIFDDTILALDVFDEEANLNRIQMWRPASSLDKIKGMVAETRGKNGFFNFNRAEIAEVFDIPIRLLSDYFDQETWMAYLKKVKQDFCKQYAQAFPIGNVLQQFGIDITVIKDNRIPAEVLLDKETYCVDTHILEKPYSKKSITDFIINNNQNSYYMGIWTMGEIKDWLYTNRRWVHDVFNFRPQLEGQNKKYLEEILQSDSVVMHIRRGDFVYSRLLISPEYFKKSVQKIKKLLQYKNLKFYIFSDDLKWCEENCNQLGLDLNNDIVRFVDGNGGKSGCIDLYLLSCGKILVPTPNSTFGYMALLLSNTIEKCVDGQKSLYELNHGQIGEINIVDICN